jgi:hypothetical protein
LLCYIEMFRVEDILLAMMIESKLLIPLIDAIKEHDFCKKYYVRKPLILLELKFCKK